MIHCEYDQRLSNLLLSEGRGIYVNQSLFKCELVSAAICILACMILGLI